MIRVSVYKCKTHTQQERERGRDVCRDCRVNLAISAALLYQTHDILQSALLTGQTVKSPARFLEGKQWIKIITGKVRAETDRPFMIRDYQRLGLFKSCSLTATEDLQAHNLMSFDSLTLSMVPVRPLTYWLLKEASDDSSFIKVHHHTPQVVHQQALKKLWHNLNLVAIKKTPFCTIFQF